MISIRGSSECKNGDDEAHCLTPAQVRTVQAFYAPLVNPRTKAQVFPGLEHGGELIWAILEATGSMVAQSGYGAGQWFRDAVFQDRNWNYETFDFYANLALADRLDNGLTAMSPNLREFIARGGKLLHYHGWSDPGVSPRSSVDYYASVLSAVGNNAQKSYRLFMVPGMGHCFGGEGPTTFDPIRSIEEWSNTGKRRIGSSLRAGLPTRSIGRGPSVRIRRSQSTRAREAPTTLTASRAKFRSLKASRTSGMARNSNAHDASDERQSI